MCDSNSMLVSVLERWETSDFGSDRVLVECRLGVTVGFNRNVLYLICSTMVGRCSGNKGRRKNWLCLKFVWMLTVERCVELCVFVNFSIPSSIKAQWGWQNRDSAAGLIRVLVESWMLMTVSWKLKHKYISLYNF